MSEERPHLRLADQRRETATPGEEPGAELVVPDDAELVETDEVVDAELVDDEPQPSEQGTSASTSMAVRVVGRLTPSAARRRQAAELAVGTVWPVGQGVHSWWVRAWGGMTHGVYRRQIRIAEATGDAERLGVWADRRQEAADRRQARLRALPGVALGLAKLALGLLLGIPAVMVVLSSLIMFSGAGSFGSLWIWVGGLLRWFFNAVAIAVNLLALSAPVLIVVAAWREGRRCESTPAWVPGTVDSAEGRQVVPDEGAIIKALQHLGIAPLNKAFKAGWRPRVVLPTTREGKGYRTRLELPPEVTVETIAEKKKTLAHNLVRFPIEVWPTEPRNLPGILDLYVADLGVLSGPVEAWPLLNAGTADYFKGVPVAVDILGKSITGLLAGHNYAIAGQMGSGKSTLAITLVLGALTDPLVDADIVVMAENADYEPMRPRLRSLRTGADDDTVEWCMDLLRGAYADLSTRGKALTEHDARFVTRDLALKDPRLRPRILVIDECQALYMHEEYGEEAEDLTVKLESAARKYAVTIVKVTPEPSSDSLPRRLIAITSNKACFAIGDQRSNDAILGTGSYKTGISAVSLEPKTEEGPGDVGTFMARGFTPKPGLLRGYFVSQTDAHKVIERCMASREKTIGTHARIPIEQQRDLLQDIADVLDGQTVNAADVPPLLAALAPRWLPYRGLTGVALREQLAGLGVRVPSTGNKWPVSPELIRRALAAGDSDDEEGDEDPS